MFTSLKPFDKGLLKTAKASALGLALCAAFGAAALAGELPKKGPYSISWTASGPYTAVEIGEEKWAWSSRFTVVIWNDAGEGIYHNMSANCVGMGTNEQELAPFDLHEEELQLDHRRGSVAVSQVSVDRTDRSVQHHVRQ